MNVGLVATPWRCLAVALGSTLALLALGAALTPDVRAALTGLHDGRLSTTPFTDLLEWLCSTVALAVATWLWWGSLQVAAAAARDRTAPRAGHLPAPVRRLVLLACGVAVASGLAVPAQAHPGHPHQDLRGTPTAALLDGLPLPERPVGAAPRPPRSARAARPPVEVAPAHRTASVVVQPGDTLWALAEEALPGPPTDHDVAGRWQRIYALNRSVVGSDPDLIQPGQRLRLPRS